MNVFVCYNEIQKKYFVEHGCRYLVYGLHPKTYKMFWAFERNEQLNMVFDEWVEICKSRPTSSM